LVFGLGYLNRRVLLSHSGLCTAMRRPGRRQTPARTSVTKREPARTFASVGAPVRNDPNFCSTPAAADRGCVCESAVDVNERCATLCDIGEDPRGSVTARCRRPHRRSQARRRGRRLRGSGPNL
jgi:hypothetical protein